MDLDALYVHRFTSVGNTVRDKVWDVVAKFIFDLAVEPRVVLDPACGFGEFISHIPAVEKWAVDAGIKHPNIDPSIHFENVPFMRATLPSNHFDLVFVSNTLEHLADATEVNKFLNKVFELLKPGGQLIVMGPNFKYTTKVYFDYADHFVPLTHLTVKEHLSMVGFQVTGVWAKFLPYSFHSRLPTSRFLVRLYLRWSLIWKILGKQFLLVAIRP